MEKYCGVPKFKFGEADVEDIVGKVAGLAWTEVGGELLTIESSYVPGKGQVIKTGSLGDVMQESIQAALTVVDQGQRNLVFLVIFTKNLMFIFMFLMARLPRMAQVQGLACVQQ